MKSLLPPHLKRPVVFGRKPPKVRGPHLRFSRYLQAGQPTAPATYDYSAAAMPSLRDVDLNNAIGDCVLASLCHVHGVLTGNAGALIHDGPAIAQAMYSAITGYNPNDPSTDQGTDEVSALNWICANGFPSPSSGKPLAWLLVDATNWAECHLAGWLFEHMIWCGGLGDDWISPFPSGDGFTWGRTTPDLNNGHSWMSFGSDQSKGAAIDTWALFGTLTPDGAASVCSSQAQGGAYVLLDIEMINRAQQKAPNGLDWQQLVEDFDAIGGNVPIPAPPSPPTPPPPPSPPPTAPPSLGTAQAAVGAAFDADGHALFVKDQAVAIATSALAPLWPPS